MDRRLPTVTLCLIVKDEEAALPLCLASVRDLVDECVVLDTGSRDRTIEVAKGFDARVFTDAWHDDFSRARNAAFAHARSDYIFWLDADDVLLPQDRERFRAFRRGLGSTVPGYTMVYDYARDAQGMSVLRFRLPRVVRRRDNFRWIGRVHEYLDGPGPLEPSDVVVTHNRQRASGDRNLRIYRAMVSADEPFSPRDRLYFANELSDHGLFDEAIHLYESAAADESMWLEDRLWALNKLAEAYESRGEREAMRRAVIQGFAWDAPRPEACCRLGYDALQHGQPRAAAAWYDMALRWAPGETGGFRIEACHTWLPHLQLAVSLSALGKLRRACWHNEAAARFVPDDENVRHNRDYFRSQGLDPAAISRLAHEPD